MAITRGIKDKLNKYGLNLPVDRRTRAYKKILSENKWTDIQYQSYLKQVLKRYTKKEKEVVRQVQQQKFRQEVAEKVRERNTKVHYIREVHYIGSIYLKYFVKSSTRNSVQDTMLQVDAKISPAKLQAHIKNRVDDFIEEKMNSYEDIQKIVIQEQVNNVVPKQAGTKLQDIKMRDAGAGIIDGYKIQEWDTQTNRCIFDYIINKYGRVKGFIRWCQDYETLNEFFQKKCDTDTDYLEKGISTTELKEFCMHFNLPMYAIDDDKKCFDYHQPSTKNGKASGIVYRLCNNHFYPVEDRATIQKVVQSTHNIKSEVMSYDHKEIKEEEGKEIDETCTSSVEYVDNVLKTLCEFIKNKQIPDSFCWLKNELQSFKHKGITYITNENLDIVKTLCDNMGIEFDGQGLGTIIFDIYKEVYENERMPKSVHNPEVLETLRNAKRNRNHYGFVDEEVDMTADGFVDEEVDMTADGFVDEEVDMTADGFVDEEVDMTADYKAYDLIKCYRNAMYNPLDAWIMFDFNDCWEDFNKKYWKNLPTGLYYVETEDTMLFKKSNVYSNTIIEYAWKCNIPFRIIYQLIPKKKELLGKDYFRPLIDKIIEYSKGDEKIAKLPINMISGLLGKSETEGTRIHLNKDTEQIMSWLDTNANLGNSILMHKLPLEDNRFLYGVKKQFKSVETNIPMYIQILDHCNIMLHQMCSSINGHLVARKADCAVFKNIISDVKTSDEWGGMRECEVPTIHKVEVCEDYEMRIDEEWDEHNIDDSDDWKYINDILDNKGGLLLQGNAGNGKTWVAMNIIKQYGTRVKVLAPTNKAALNIGGNTIHLFLKMSEEGKVSSKLLNIIRDNYDLIVVDEISMIDADMWRRLCLLKQQANVKFLLLGDDKQCPPVEVDGLDSYFNHPAVRYLTNNQRNTLTIRKRYDEELYNMLQDVNDIDTKRFLFKETQVNICYYNDTAIFINKMWNDRLRTPTSLFIPMNEDDDKSQDMYVYEGLPVIAMKNKRDKEGIVWANSEKFYVCHFDNENIVLMTERPNDNGIKEPYVIDVAIDDFKHNFYLNYCCTTHKMQGETLTENFTIYDWKNMDTKLKYTALSRAKKPDQVYIFDGIVPRRPDTFVRNINKKLKGYKEQDKKNKLKNDIKVDDVKTLYQKQNGECKLCGCCMKQTYKNNDDKQFSVDRIDSKVGHVKENIQLLCWGCNRAKKNRF